MTEIFISYRRDDVPGQVGRLYARLADHYGDEAVFMDVESLVLGQRFEEVILERISRARVMLVVMGPSWQAVRHRPDGEPDLFQVEVDTAIANNTTISALLVDRTTAPDAKTLPKAMQEVFDRQAFSIRQEAFNRDVSALIEGLEKTGIKPSARHRRRRVEAGLAAGGWPYSWLAALSRAITPMGIAAAALAAIAGIGWVAANRIQRTSFEAGMSQATEAHESERQRHNESEATLTGRVTDSDFNNVRDAVVSFHNERNQQRGEARTDSKGMYTFRLYDIDVIAGDRILVEIAKAGFQTMQERVRFDDEFREFRTTLLKGRGPT
jgi:hypothetical protein